MTIPSEECAKDELLQYVVYLISAAQQEHSHQIVVEFDYNDNITHIIQELNKEEGYTVVKKRNGQKVVLTITWC